MKTVKLSVMIENPLTTLDLNLKVDSGFYLNPLSDENNDRQFHFCPSSTDVGPGPVSLV